VACCSEHGNEQLGSIKCGKFHECGRNCSLLKKALLQGITELLLYYFNLLHHITQSIRATHIGKCLCSYNRRNNRDMYGTAHIS